MLLARNAGWPAALNSNQPTESDSTSQPGNVINAAGVVGVILPENARALQNLYPLGTAYWTPSVGDVLEAETRLEPFLKASKHPEVLQNLKTYKRQYRGIFEGGQKFLVIRFFCDTPLKDLTEQETVILDGGPCFFNVRYSISTQTFSDLKTVLHVCADATCKTHRQFSHYEISPQEREQRRKLAFAIRVQKESRLRIPQAVREKLPPALARADFEMVALDYFRRLGHDNHHRLFLVYGWDEKKTKTS